MESGMMKVLFDTSVLIAAFTAGHLFHGRAQPLVRRAHAAEFEWFISQHTIAEVYRVLTAMPDAMPPNEASKMIEVNFFKASGTVVGLTPDDYLQIIKRQGELKNGSGKIFDALIAQAARKAGVDHLYTFNPKHFLRVWPEGAGIIVEP
jgi:predicted nucleic acid-binding protein